MNETLKNKITEMLTTMSCPGDQNMSVADILESLHVDNGHAMITLKVDPKHGTALEGLRQQVEMTVATMPGIERVTAVLTAERPAGPKVSDRDVLARPMAAGVKHIIAVASGKGGVGKSTVAANLAVALARQGQKTGLVDADIYGPSQHRMLGVSAKAESTDDRRLIPQTVHGIKVISIGMMVDEDRPMIWRGPMVQTAVTQFFRDVVWDDIDVLVVDMPPGTGDAQMTLAQKVPVSGAVIVSTPQDIALIDARKGLNMFSKMDVPVLGIIENMSQHTCSNCGHTENIFGHGGAQSEAAKLNVPFLGALPLDIHIRTYSDDGTPIVIAEPEHPASRIFEDMAREIMAGVLNR